MEAIQAIVGEGRALEGLPFEAGIRVEVKRIEEVPMTDEQWHAGLREMYGCLPDWNFEQFDRNYPEPIEPLFLTENNPKP